MSLSGTFRHGTAAAMLRAVRVFGISLSCTGHALAAANCGELLDQVTRSIVFVNVARQNDYGIRTDLCTGTGFIVTVDGMIMTAGHLIPEDREKVVVSASIGLRGGHPYPLIYTRKDSRRADVALLQLPKGASGKKRSSAD